MDFNILQQQDKQRFVVLMDNHEAVIEYKLDGNKVDFTRTFVPEELRGKGIAGQLVREALTWAKSNDYEISSSCWYVKKFL